MNTPNRLLFYWTHHTSVWKLSQIVSQLIVVMPLSRDRSSCWTASAVWTSTSSYVSFTSLCRPATSSHACWRRQPAATWVVAAGALTPRHSRACWRSRRTTTKLSDWERSAETRADWEPLRDSSSSSSHYQSTSTAIFIARQHSNADARYRYRNSVRPSVNVNVVNLYSASS